MANWVILALALALGTVGDKPSTDPQTMTKTGRVVTLAEALKAKGVAADPDSLANQVALVESNGTVTPLLSTEASRALFLDEHLRNRKTQLIARKVDGLPYLQVVSFKIEDGGVLRTPEYYCEVCHISVRYPQICPCCQGSMELRMKPE